MRRISLFGLLALVACDHPPVEHTPRAATLDTSAAPSHVGTPHAIALPGATGPVGLDYLAYDPAHDRVWIPAGGTGRVDVIDVKTEQITAIEGFPTKEVERRGKKMHTGPSAATVGDGVVYIGSRADSSVCAVDAASLEKRDCLTLDSSPDGLQYVAATKELWVTTPRDKSIRILDVSTPGHPVAKDKIVFEGEPEGFAVDNERGVFYTNLEDKDETLAIDLKTHAIAKHWQPKCGEDGPKGLVLDAPANHLVVVCPDHVETLDAGHDGALIGTLAVGKGLDAIDLVPSRHLVAAAAGGAAKMSFATLEPDGKLTEIASVATTKGARNAVLSTSGTAFVAVGPSGSILVVPAPAAR
jgi:hypothetical protein